MRVVSGRRRGMPVALALVGLLSGAPAANAAGDAPTRRFTVAYGLSFLNLRVGEATLAVERAGERYALELEAGLRGLAGFFLDGAGKATVAGSTARGGAATFRVDSRYAGKPVAVSLELAGGRVRSTMVEPPPTPRPDRVPVAPDDLIGVVDPLTMLTISLKTSALEAALCDRRIAVFDGAMRADLMLSRGSVVEVTEGAYRGPALDCRVRWVPVSGHRAQGANVRRMAENDDLRVRFAPILDGTLLLPVSISVATGWGTVRIEATRWGGEAPAAPEQGANVKVRLPNER
ncbi:DUF3108 domain-containing protein [Methylobacterium sp.]|uniref:DUF3108 domain-containing protein n=1 Tax=Methylobacterium sp. TaxID=409 RepID=UPI0026039B61|nr:DUF3108 domain-containing protein [Methylobacterium sp.]MDB5646995.1 hypothetical protein [Methylobacterium sp.]